MLFALASISIYNPAFVKVAQLPAIEGGVVFSAKYDRLYTVDAVSNQLQERDESTLQILRTFTMSEDVENSEGFHDGEMSVSANGAYVFLSTPMGVRVFTVGIPHPKLTAVVPPLGDHDQTTHVSVLGANFDAGVTQVLFGGVPATNVAYVDNQTLTCDVPPGVPGPIEVQISTASGSASKSSGFRYKPDLIAPESVAVGSSLDLILEFTPPAQVAQFFGLPAAFNVALPPFAGTLALNPFFLLYVDLGATSQVTLTTLPIPNDPALSGLGIAFQALVGPDLGNKHGAFTNRRVVTLQ